jgi:hypothetical protein
MKIVNKTVMKFLVPLLKITEIRLISKIKNKNSFCKMKYSPDLFKRKVQLVLKIQSFFHVQLINLQLNIIRKTINSFNLRDN